MAGYEDVTIISSGKMIFEPILEEGVFRFDCSRTDKDKKYHPSLSFTNSEARDRPIDVHNLQPLYIPSFEHSHGQQTTYFEFPIGTSFYGTGEVSGELERTGKRVVAWNDAWGYATGTTSLYQSHPWVLAILPNGEAFGVLADTTRSCEIDLSKESVMKFLASASFPVITFGPFTSPSAVLISLSHAIGTIFMPPKWSLGYHQCRYSYDSDEKVLKVANTFREKGIPCDVIWMDIDYMDGFRCFTFDKEHFSEPKALVNDLHDNGFKAIWMLDPGIKHEEGYFVYDSGSEIDIWIKKSDGQHPFVGEVWPGSCVFPDFTQEKARLWWANLVKNFVTNGVDGLWNDMNEPAVFKTDTLTMPDDNIHSGDIKLGGRQNHSHYHNVYGMLMARSTLEGMKLANEKKRPFVLTRAGFIGSQRYAATWTGDNLSNWEHLHESISMVLHLGLSGQPLSGPDIGGFIGNATPKLFARWMGIGAMLPFCRGHSEKDTLDHEPWSFGDECEEVCRLALMRRYRLIPHIYTMFYMAHTKGTPVATPTFFADPKDPRLRTVENSFLLGPLLVQTSTLSDHGSDELLHVLPKGIWLRFDFDDSHPDLPILYLQGGSILPTGHPMQHVGEANLTNDLTLVVSLDEHGKAEGALFEDEGDGYEFNEGGYLLTYYAAEYQSSVVTIKVSKCEGSWARPKRRLHVKLLLGGGAMVNAWGVDGEILEIRMPSNTEISELVSISEEQRKNRLETAKRVPDREDEVSEHKKMPRTPLELRSSDWVLKVVPWIGGRMISMHHIPSGTEWLHSKVDEGGYEEYSSGIKDMSSGCSEEYDTIERKNEQGRENESLNMEGDIGGGLVFQRKISISENDSSVIRIDSGIMAQNLAAVSGGYSRLVCLRVHPVFAVLHPKDVCVTFVSINGCKHEVWPESSVQVFEGELLPNGAWTLVDRILGLGLVNKFDVNEVHKCLIHWETATVSMELCSKERRVSTESPLRISHQYEVKSE